MKTRLKSALLSILCGATALGAMPPEAFAMSVAPPSAVGLTAPVAQVHFRRYYSPRYRPVVYRRHWAPRYAYHPRRAYYRYPAYGYGYDPAGAIFAGAALGLMGAGIAAATAPRWGYGGWGGGWGPGWGGGWGWGGPGFWW